MKMWVMSLQAPCIGREKGSGGGFFTRAPFALLWNKVKINHWRGTYGWVIAAMIIVIYLISTAQIKWFPVLGWLATQTPRKGFLSGWSSGLTLLPLVRPWQVPAERESDPLSFHWIFLGQCWHEKHLKSHPGCITVEDLFAVNLKLYLCVSNPLV